MDLGFIKTSLINNIARGGVWEYGVCEMRKREGGKHTILQMLALLLCLKNSAKFNTALIFCTFLYNQLLNQKASGGEGVHRALGRPIQPSTQPDISGRQMGMISQGHCNEVTVTLSLSGKRLRTEHNKAINKGWKILILILSRDFSMMQCALQNKAFSYLYFYTFIKQDSKHLFLKNIS